MMDLPSSLLARQAFLFILPALLLVSICREMGVAGLSVTIPHKEAVIRRLSPVAYQ